MAIGPVTCNAAGSIDAGIIDCAQAIIGESVVHSLDALMPLALLFLGLCVVLALVTAFMVMHGEPVALLKSVLLVTLGVAIGTLALNQWGNLSDVLARTASNAGLAAAGHVISVEEFMSPGTFVAKAAAITNPINQYLKDMGYSLIYRPDLTLSMAGLSTILGLTWVCMGMNTVFALTLYKILTPVGFLGVAFMFSPSLRWFGFSLIRLLVSASVQLFCIAWFTSVLTMLIPYLTLSQSAALTLWIVVVLAGVSGVLLFIAVIVPLLSAGGAFVASGVSAVKSVVKAVPGT